jgi:hypothetical protein
VPFEEERARDDQLLKSPILLEGGVPSLPVRKVLSDDRIVLSWVLLVLVHIVGIAFLLGKILR